MRRTGDNPDTFFRVNFQQLMIDNLDLPSIVPILSAMGLLTKHEQERLLNELIRGDKRVMELVGMLSKKGSGCVRRFMECLRKETVHQGHKDLLCAMEQSFGHTHTQEEVPSISSSHQAPPPASSVEAQAQGPSTLSCLGSLYHPTSHTCQGAQHGRFVMQLNCMSFAYQDTISRLAQELSVRSLPLESMLKVVQQLLPMAEFHPATQITDFVSLHSYLVDNGICGPIDVDFLVALLTVLEQHDLAGLVLDYATKIGDENVFTPNYQSVNPTIGSEENFILFTGYHHDAARICEVWDLKETLSNLFDIQRHYFWFAGSQLSPFVLVWHFPSAFAELCTAVLCENRSQLVSQLSLNSLPCSSVHYWLHSHQYTLLSHETAESHQSSSLVHVQPGLSTTTAAARGSYHGLGKLF